MHSATHMRAQVAFLSRAGQSGSVRARGTLSSDGLRRLCLESQRLAWCAGFACLWRRFYHLAMMPSGACKVRGPLAQI